MVKRLSELYLDARKAIMQNEDPQSASLMARNLICHFTGKTQEQLLADRENYVGEDICAKVDEAVQRLMDGEPLAYILQE